MNIYIDILRIFLCLSIVLFHMEGGWLGVTSISGGVCVDGFFVLSGFLHGLPKAKRSLSRLYVNQSVRIFPLLTLAIIFSIGIHWNDFVSSINEYGGGYYVRHPGRLISLIESYNVVLWFMVPYIIFVMMTPLYQRGNSWVKSVFIAVVLLFPLYFHIRHGDLYKELSYNPLCIAWQYGLGLVIGSNSEKYAPKIPPVWAYIMFALVIIAGFVPAEAIAWKHEWLVSNAAISVLFGVGLLALCNTDSFPALSRSNRWVAALSLLSGMTYSIFLFHCPILHLGLGHIISFILILVLAYVLRMAIETPISHIRK